MGHGCVVVAPSLIPRKPGERIKIDRRDAVNLAKLHRAGELTAVWVPDPAHEAIRDLVRARLAAVRTLRQARQQLSGSLLRHGHHYPRTAWTLMHRRWLAGSHFEQPVHHIVLEDCIAAVEAAMARRQRLEAHIEAMLPDWSLAPVVRALQALRGMALVAAATLVAELGDMTRFANPRQESLAKPIRDTAWKAQERLCRRYRKLIRAGKLPTVATAAIARELAGFVWAIAQQAHSAGA